MLDFQRRRAVVIMTILVDPSVVMRMVYLGLDLGLTISVDLRKQVPKESRVNRDAPLKQLMIEWAARANVDYTVCRILNFHLDPSSKMSSRVHVKKGKNKKGVAPTKPSSNFISVKVVSNLETLNPYFWVTRDAPLKQLMMEWGARANVDYTVCRFMHEGKQIQDFKMEDDDCIFVLMHGRNY
nr:hypothetical protein [Tanacetum cinerariifolium]